MALALATALATVLAGVGAAQANTGPDQKKAQESVAWLNNFACPVPGRHIVVPGLETASQVEALRASNWDFSQKTHTKMMEASTQLDVFLEQSANRTLNSKDMAALTKLQTEGSNATARVATALVNWSLANFVEISRANPDFDARRQDHPLKGQLQQAQALRQFVANFYTLQEKATLLAPVEKKFWACLQAAQLSFIDGSAASIRKAKAEAHSAADIDRIINSYVLIKDPAPSSAVLTELASAKEEFIALERLAAEEREKLRQQQLAQQEKERAQMQAAREAEERERNAKRIAQATSNLPVAKKLVMTLNAGMVSEASTVMDEDISLSIPGMSTTYGRSAVLQLMNRGSGSQGGAIEPPQVTSRGDIVSDGQGSRGRFQLYIDISGGLVTAMRIVR